MLDIIIACFNKPIFLETMLTSIKKHISDLSKISVIIIDDCSAYSKEYLKIIDEF